MHLAGELTKISLANLIQHVRTGELTGKVSLTHGANLADIYVRGGRIIHVQTDVEQGREALLELFLWLSGSFVFSEGQFDGIQQTFSSDEPVEKLVREGLAYLEKKKHLDQLRINGGTVLDKAQEDGGGNPLWSYIDGRSSLTEISQLLGLSRREHIYFVHDLLINGRVVVIEPHNPSGTVHLPPWVVSRLQQDNRDVAQAIVEMVIWVDRVKCWMYQADADLDKVVERLTADVSGDTSESAPASAPAARAGKSKFNVAALVADLDDTESV